MGIVLLLVLQAEQRHVEIHITCRIGAVLCFGCRWLNIGARSCFTPTHTWRKNSPHLPIYVEFEEIDHGCLAPGPLV